MEVLPRYSTMDTVKYRPPELEDAGASPEVLQTSTSMGTVPEGRLYSRKLILDQLRMLAAMLGVTAKVTCAQTRQLIEGGLMERGYEPRNVQVMIDGEWTDVLGE